MAEPKFIVDFMLGRLCRWLRLLGYDTVFFSPLVDQSGRLNIGYESLKQGRVVLTRNRKISSRKVFQLIFIGSDYYLEQIQQVLTILQLKIDEKKIFTRCLDCNSLLIPIEKEKMKNRVPNYVYETQKEFSICLHCQKIYWKGTHWDLALAKIKEI